MTISLFPCVVSDGYDLYRGARILTVGTRALVFQHDGENPFLARELELSEQPDPRRQIRTLRTEQGEWTVDNDPALGCGCRHPLKHVSRDALLRAAGVNA